MTYRRYTMEVKRTQGQTVTFIAAPANQLALDRIAAAHCEESQWGETTYSHYNLTSSEVTVSDYSRDEEVMNTDAVIHSVWLHGDWKAVTKPLTTEQKEAMADAVERYSSRIEHASVTVDRWWRSDEIDR